MKDIYSLLRIFIFITGSLALNNSSQLRRNIIKGVHLDQRQIGFEASIRVRRKHLCSGCLISEDYILTTASCVYAISEHVGSILHLVTVIIGTVDLSVGGTKHDIRRAMYHYEYKPFQPVITMQYNIGLIQLANRFLDLNAFWIPMADDVTHANTMAVTTGWNARSADLDRFSISCQSNVLKVYNVQIEGLSFCNSYFVNEFKNLSLCGSVKFEEKRLNQGYGGSPLAYQNELIGIVTDYVNLKRNSSVIACARISYFKKDIQRMINGTQEAKFI